jgi:hypothetical protein
MPDSAPPDARQRQLNAYFERKRLEDVALPVYVYRCTRPTCPGMRTAQTPDDQPLCAQCGEVCARWVRHSVDDKPDGPHITPATALSPENREAFDRLRQRLEEPNILTWARAYLDAGLSPIPVRPDSKHPPVAWKPFQSRRATEVELERWFANPGNWRIGLVTGRISGHFVIDVDYRHGGQNWIDETLLAETAFGIVKSSDGRHYYFVNPPQERIKSRNAMRPGVDKKAEGSIVVLPPSHGYMWERYLKGLA